MGISWRLRSRRHVVSSCRLPCHDDAEVGDSEMACCSKASCEELATMSPGRRTQVCIKGHQCEMKVCEKMQMCVPLARIERSQGSRWHVHRRLGCRLQLCERGTFLVGACSAIVSV